MTMAKQVFSEIIFVLPIVLFPPKKSFEQTAMRSKTFLYFFLMSMWTEVFLLHVPVCKIDHFLAVAGEEIIGPDDPRFFFLVDRLNSCDMKGPRDLFGVLSMRY